ncbi:hypothetical protein AMV260 [Betaentomopoxvirus amoorei]|uniref:AMV260 n=1 Tax=Amsacta moorei entomopoxvirus TaxID=28321 RepID=Q9EME6_AMEPV|nr:hypothetical protein AMV260 [Amsacta moorei entomopoxvirus]AAG02966.1 AMV260 [Amsacta moorei entomopoxvirus]
MLIDINDIFNNRKICTICREIIELSKNDRCLTCNTLHICTKCSYNTIIQYHFNIIKYAEWVYVRQCLKCILDQVFNTNIMTYSRDVLLEIINNNNYVDCEHRNNLYNIFKQKNHSNENINNFIYKIDNTKNFSNNNNVFKYNNSIIHDKKCFICVYNFIKINYNFHKIIFRFIIFKINLYFKIDDNVLDIPLKNINFKYEFQSRVINFTNTHDHETKIISKLIKNRYDRFYNFDKNYFCDNIIDLYNNSIDNIKKKELISNAEYKYYLYCNVKTPKQQNILTRLKNIDEYNVDVKLFNKFNVINNHNNVLKESIKIIKNYKYILTLDFKDAFERITYPHICYLVNKYILCNKLKNDILNHYIYMNNIFSNSKPKLILNDVSPYIFKMCMYDIIQKTINKNIEFLNICDDFIFFENDIYKLFYFISNFIKYIYRHTNMRININKYRLYEKHMQNIYFLNTVIFPSLLFRLKINKWRHRTYMINSKVYFKLIEKYSNNDQYFINNK